MFLVKTKTIMPAREHEYVRSLSEDELGRTALKYSTTLGGSTIAQTWNHRKAMARTIRMMERNSPQASWRPCVPLTDGEGY